MKQLSIKDLLPNTQYAVQVRVITLEETSDWSRRFIFKTIDDDIVPKTPTNVTFTAGDDVFVAEWDRVVHNNDNSHAKIINYELEFTADGVKKTIDFNPSFEPGQKRVSYTLTPERIRAKFGSFKKTISLRIRAMNWSENLSAWSTSVTATLEAPDPPTNAVVTPVPLGLDISWTPPANRTNVVGYRVYVTSGDDPNFSTVGLKPVYQGSVAAYSFFSTVSKLTHFKIVSYSRQNLESTPLLANGTPLPIADFQPPPGVTGLTGSVTTAANGKTATGNVSWSHAGSDDMNGFNLRYRAVGTTVWQGVALLGDARSATFEAKPYTNYEGMIEALDKENNSSGWSEIVQFPGQTNTPPPTVTGLAAAQVNIDSIKYTWNESTATDVAGQAGGYDLQISTDATFATNSTILRTGYPFEEANVLMPNTTYYARVRAVDSTGLTSTSWSSTVSAKTGSYPTTALTDGKVPGTAPTPTVAPGIGYIYASWLPLTVAVDGTTQYDTVTYEVHLGTTSGFTPTASTKVFETAATSGIIDVLPGTTTALSYGTPYYVRLVAKDRDGAGAAGGTSSSVTPSKAALVDISATLSDFGGITPAQVDTKIATSANGINRTIWSTNAASGTTDGTRAYVNGDTWMQRDASGNVIGQWEFVSGSGWLARKISHQTIASIDVGNMTVLGKLGAANIEATSLTIQESQIPTLSTSLTNAASSGSSQAQSALKTLWGGSATATTINGGVLANNSVLTTKLAVADFLNYIADADLADPNFGSWSGGPGLTRTAASGTTPAYITWTGGNGTNAHIFNNYIFNAAAGDEFYFSCEVSTPATNTANISVYGAIQTKDASGAVLTWPQLPPKTLAPNSAWQVYQGTLKITGATTAKAQFDPFANAAAAGQQVSMRNMRLRRRNGGELIVDGAVTANTIGAGTFTGGAFVIGAGGSLRTNAGNVVVSDQGISVTGTGSNITATSLTTGDLTSTATVTVKGNINVGTGFIQSQQFIDTGGASGFQLSNTGLIIKSGQVSAGTITTGSISGGAAITLSGSSYIHVASGFIRGGGYTGTSASSNPSGQGWYLGSDGLVVPQNATVSAGNITSGTISSASIQITSSGSIYGTGWSLGSAGLYVGSTGWNSSTSIDGSLIKTGSIVSNDWNGSTVGWAINKSGSATFNNVTIRGATLIGGTLSSSGFVDGASTGWKLDSSGNFYANSGTFRGKLEAASGTFSGSLSSANGTFSRLSTTATAGTGVTLDVNGLDMYSTTGVQNVIINQNGYADFSGTVTANSFFSWLAIEARGDLVSTQSLRANSVYANEYSGGTQTDAGIGSGGKLIRLSASSLRYKSSPEPLVINPETILSVEPRTFYMNDVENYGTGRHPGFIAEEVANIGGLDLFIYRDRLGRPDGFQYSRWAVAQQIVLRHLDAENKTLKARVESLEQRMERLEAALN